MYMVLVEINLRKHSKGKCAQNQESNRTYLIWFMLLCYDLVKHYISHKKTKGIKKARNEVFSTKELCKQRKCKYDIFNE